MTTNVRSDIRQVIDENRKNILAFLEDLVNCNSYTHNKAGIDEAGRMVAREMPGGFAHQVVKSASLGDHHIHSHTHEGVRPILLAGHLDTLCPPAADSATLQVRDETLVGPGVNDMKGGDVVLIWALKVLESLGLLEQMSIVCIFNGDEELGSPTSRDLFLNMRDKASLAFVFECGGPAGTVVTTRKGISRYRMHFTGEPAHFGNLKSPKISAVEELARKTIAIEALNRSDGSLVANVGRVEGGLLANVVAASASMDFEIRYWNEVIGRETRAHIEAMPDSSTVPGCKSKLEQLSCRPAMLPTPDSMRLFRTIVDLGAELDKTIIEEKRGGVSDACFLSHVGIPTIDGLGPLGDHDHSPDEYIVTRTLFSRIELMSNLLLGVTETGPAR